MIPSSVERLLKSPSKDNAAALLEDESAVFHVDWREEDDAIARYCEAILRTGSLAAKLVDIEAEPGFELYISHAGKKVTVPLVVGPADRHTTLRAINRVLAPDYEVRVCVASNGMDTLAFLPLSAADWKVLEGKYGLQVAKHFRKIEKTPNLFTEAW